MASRDTCMVMSKGGGQARKIMQGALVLMGRDSDEGGIAGSDEAGAAGISKGGT